MKGNNQMAFETDNNSTDAVNDGVPAATDTVIQEDSWETMSDEEFASLDYESLAEQGLLEEEQVEEELPPESEEEVVEEGDSGEEMEEEEDTETDVTNEDEEDSNTGETSEDESEEDFVEETDTNYKDAYEKIFAPFKANGHEIKVDSPEDVVRLMQMGANYNAKMAALKPGLKTLKLLEKNELLDENKLALLIDANNGNPEAIKKLIQTHKIDTYNLDLDNETDYKPQVETVSDKEYALSEVMGSLKSSPHYEKTLNVVTKVWDSESKQIVVNEPHLLETINRHIDTGMYDIVQAEVIKQRALGRLNGVNDIVAYKQIGDMLDEQGAFDHLVPKPAETTSKQRQPIARKPKSPANAAKKNTEKLRGVTPTRQASSQTTSKPEGFNPLDMSDEDFEKQFDPRLM